MRADKTPSYLCFFLSLLSTCPQTDSVSPSPPQCAMSLTFVFGGNRCILRRCFDRHHHRKHTVVALASGRHDACLTDQRHWKIRIHACQRERLARGHPFSDGQAVQHIHNLDGDGCWKLACCTSESISFIHLSVKNVNCYTCVTRWRACNVLCNRLSLAQCP